MRFSRFLAEHWRGALPLWLALAGPVAVSAVLLWAVNRALSDWPVLWLAVLNAPLAIWAVVGAFRTADRALREGGGFVAGFAAYAGAGAVLLAAGTTLVARQTPVRTITAGSLATEAPAGITVPTDLAFVDLPEADGRLRIEGDIGFAHYNALKARLAQGGVLALDLDSAGGNIYAARGLVRLIEAAGVETHAETRCYSACTLLFAAGRRRTIGSEGALGFHRYFLQASSNYGPIRHVHAAKEEAKDRAYLARRGISEDFIARAYGTPPEALWHPSRAELEAAGVLTE